MNEHQDTDRLISMRNTMILAYILLAAVAFVILTVFLVTTKNKALNAQSQNYCAVATAQSAKSVDHFCSDIVQTAGLIYENRDYTSFYPRGGYLSPEEDKLRDDLDSLFSKADFMSDYCDFGIIYSDNSHVGIISDGTLDLLSEDAFSSVSKLIGQTDQCWKVFYSGTVSRICYMKRVNDNAVLVASVYATQFSYLFGNMSASSNLSIYVADENNRIIYSTDSATGDPGEVVPYEYTEKFEGKKNTSVGDSSGVVALIETSNGWKVMTVVVPTTLGVFGKMHIETFIVILALSVLFVFVVTGFIIASFYSSKRRSPRILEDRIDPVTGALSPYYCEERISDLIEISLVGGTWAFALVRISDYELIEQRLGVEFAGEAMKKVSDMISESFGDKVTLGLDQERDFVLFCDFSDYDIFKAHNDLRTQFGDLRTKLDNVTVGQNGDYKLDISVGVCIYPDHGKTFEELDFKARTALATAMEDTKGKKLCFFDEKKSGGGKK